MNLNKSSDYLKNRNYIFMKYFSFIILIILGNVISKAKSYWIHGKTSCQVIEITANNSTPIENNSTDCTVERSVICKLNILKAMNLHNMSHIIKDNDSQITKLFALKSNFFGLFNGRDQIVQFSNIIFFYNNNSF